MSCQPCRQHFSSRSMVPRKSVYLLQATIISFIITSLVFKSKRTGDRRASGANEHGLSCTGRRVLHRVTAILLHIFSRIQQ